MSWMAAAAVGGSIISGMMGGSAAKKAARKQAAAVDRATQLKREMYQQNRKDMAGYRDLGGRGLDEMNANFVDLTRSFEESDFKKDPGYDFRMAEGQKALERSAAARGRGGGGRALKAITRYGQDYGSNEYQKVYNRFNQDRDSRYGKLKDMIGIGQSAAAGTAAAGSNMANSVGGDIVGGGNAQAGAILAGGQAKADAASGIMSGIGSMLGSAGSGKTQSNVFAGAPYQQSQSLFDPGKLKA